MMDMTMIPHLKAIIAVTTAVSIVRLRHLKYRHCLQEIRA